MANDKSNIEVGDSIIDDRGVRWRVMSMFNGTVHRSYGDVSDLFYVVDDWKGHQSTFADEFVRNASFIEVEKKNR